MKALSETCGPHSFSIPYAHSRLRTIRRGGGFSLSDACKQGVSIAFTAPHVIVYEPDRVLVTGGGRINSPAGAYAGDQDLTGRANFGFVWRYQRGQQVPSGNTQFQFRPADLNFNSIAYDWLMIAGARAQYKGVGVINGAGNYGFMLTAIDGQQSGGGADNFRIKIWDRDNNDEVVYDNQMGESDTGDDATELGGGSIMIHSGGGGGPNR